MFGLADILGGLIFAVAGVIFFLLTPLGLAYIALRVRDARHATTDKWLGLKTAFHTVHTLAVLMVLTGLTVSAMDLMEGQLTGNPKNQPPQPQFQPGFGPPRPQPVPAPQDEFWNTAQRSAVALAATGFLFGLVFWGLLVSGTNERRYPAVRRTFVGGRLAVCLLVVFAATTVVAVVLAQKDPKLDPVEQAVGVLMVWLPGSAVHLFLFHQAARRPIEPDLSGTHAVHRRPAGGIELTDEDED
jgi:hypothetical protein